MNTTNITMKVKPWKRRVGWSVACLVVVWLVGSGAATWSLTRRARVRADEPLPTVDWAQFSEHRLTTTDHESLGCWMHEGAADRPVAILLHGIGSRRSNETAEAQVFARLGCSVLLVTLRAHGDSTGDSCDVGWSSRLDLLAAVELCEQRLPDRPIVVAGRSMGAAAAIFASQELGERVSGYLLEQPYQDLGTAVWNRLENRLPPGVDLAIYAGMRVWAPVCLPVSLDEISPVQRIGHIPQSTPVWILAGSADMSARPSEAQALHAQVASHGQLVMIAGWKHVPCTRFAPDRYQDVVTKWLTATTKATENRRTGFQPVRTE